MIAAKLLRVCIDLDFDKSSLKPDLKYLLNHSDCVIHKVVYYIQQFDCRPVIFGTIEPKFELSASGFKRNSAAFSTNGNNPFLLAHEVNNFN